jgi:hypothetical protein
MTAKPRRQNAKVSETQAHLVWIWGTGFVACFCMMLALTAAGSFEGRAQEAWAWFLPTILPTLAVTLSAAVAQAQKPQAKVVSTFISRLAKAVSIFYLSLVLVTLMLWPLTGNGPLQWFTISGLWLGPIQASIGSVLAVFMMGQKEA